MRTLVTTLTRLLLVEWVILRRLLLPLATARGRSSGPERVRMALSDLGGGFNKLGQVLALRFDVLPPEYCYALFDLLDSVPPFPFSDVERVIAEELGAGPDVMFREFEREPLASASIGQVHRAILPSGEKVAVKVQRPGIRRLLQADITLMYFGAAMLDRTRLLGRTRSRDVVTTFAAWTVQELDYRVEARNGGRLALNAGDDELEHNARIYPSFSSERVLTLELLEGIPLIEIFRARQRGDEAHLDRLRAQGVDLDRIASHIVWNVLNQIYLFGFFHADLHPANLFVMPGNAIGYIDFGIVGRLTPDLRESLMLYARNLYSGNVDGAVDELMGWIKVSERTDVEAARAELVLIMDDYLLSLRDSEEGAARAGASNFELALLAIVRRHEMAMAQGAVTYLKALVTVDAVVFELNPDFNLDWHENHFFSRLVSETSLEWLDYRKLAGAAFDYGIRINRVLDSLSTANGNDSDVGEIVPHVRRRVRILASLCAGAAALALYGVADTIHAEPLFGWLSLHALLTAILAFALAIVLSGGRLPNRRENGRLVRTDTLRRRLRRTRIDAKGKGRLGG